MKKELKMKTNAALISHAELASPKVMDYIVDMDSTYKLRSTETVLENKRYVKKVVYNTVDQVEFMKGLKASDFDLENIIAVGALDSLKDCQLSGDSLGDVDRASVSIDNIISAVDSAVSNN